LLPRHKHNQDRRKQNMIKKFYPMILKQFRYLLHQGLVFS